MSHFIGKLFFIVNFLAVLCNAGSHELSLFTRNINGTVNSLVITTNITDLRAFSPGIVSQVQKICTSGIWIIYSGVNYTGTPVVFPRCFREWWKGSVCIEESRFVSEEQKFQLGSARYLAADEHNSGLTIFSEINYEGDQYKIDQRADAHLPFPIKSFIIAGTYYTEQKWTFYSGPNFNGSETCHSTHTGSKIYGTTTTYRPSTGYGTRTTTGYGTRTTTGYGTSTTTGYGSTSTGYGTSTTTSYGTSTTTGYGTSTTTGYGTSTTTGYGTSTTTGSGSTSTGYGTSTTAGSGSTSTGYGTSTLTNRNSCDNYYVGTNSDSYDRSQYVKVDAYPNDVGSILLGCQYY